MTDPAVPGTTVPAFGRLKAFDFEKEKISTYLEQVELYFEVNGVPEAKRAAVLLTVIGTTTYAIIKSLVAPDLPRTKSLDELVTVLKSHFEPKPLVIAERFRFYKRNQNATETVLEYAAELRRLAISCEFEAFLDSALRDKFVCGLRSEHIQKGLLTEADLTMTRAVETAHAKETASRDAKDLKGSGLTAISKLTRSTSHSPACGTTNCHRCGSTDHKGQQCRFRQAKCRTCGLKGHISTACWNKNGSSTPKKFQKRRRVRQVDATEPAESESDLGEYCVSIMTNSKSKSKTTQPITVEVNMSGQDVSMELDTGAAVTVMSYSTFKKLFPHLKTRRSQLVLKIYTGQAMKVVGEVTMSVSYQGQPAKSLDLVVVQGNGTTLLGRDWLKYIRLDWKTIGSVSREASVSALLDTYSDVFSSKLGTIRPFKATLLTTPGASPKFMKARTVPFSQRADVEAELERLELQGVLEKVRHSDWATPMPKKDGRTRICGDYKVPVNPVLEVDQYLSRMICLPPCLVELASLS